MDFDFTRLPARDRYRLLTNFVAPRPIALVTTRSPAGHDNAAPMSFFNVFSHEPPSSSSACRDARGWRRTPPPTSAAPAPSW